MRRGKLDLGNSLSRHRSIQILMIILFLYLLIMSFEMPIVFRSKSGLEFPEVDSTTQLPTLPTESNKEDEEDPHGRNARIMKEHNWVSGLLFDEITFNSTDNNKFSELHKTARDAFVVGRKSMNEIQSGKVNVGSHKVDNIPVRATLSCPDSVILTGKEFKEKGNVTEIPCGLMFGSYITVIGKPGWAHVENQPTKGVNEEDENLMVSQFMMELQGLRTVDGEDPPKVLHFNPRIKGDWSERPVIEQNTCYRMQWGEPLRCEGWKSTNEDEDVDGQVICSRWIRDDDKNSEESKTTWWLKRLVGRRRKVENDWPFPFAEDKMFVLTLTAGLEGYHVNVDGRHVTSFPYRTGFTLEDATGLSLMGDIEVRAIFATALPTSHSSFDPQESLEMVAEWRAPPLPDRPIELFIGILSAGNHFAERMAIRKSWFQDPSIRSSNIVARFFVAMHGRKEMNVAVIKEAEFFRDIVIVPYMDNYDLVVLKTVAICEYGVRKMVAKHVMKCDDDTFVRIDAVRNEVERNFRAKSLYLGNMNYYTKPLRNGKWSVSYEEWPEEEYPPYANGAGYVLSSDIAQFIVSEFEKHKLRLFKMEDVSVGMWVKQFNSSSPVEYVHNIKFCQFGCTEYYYTAHYQSPRQMSCLWKKLEVSGQAECCNMR